MKARGTLGYLPRVPLISLPKFTFREHQKMQSGADLKLSTPLRSIVICIVLR